jgi:uncharacterized protein (TIGR02246 family)
MTARRSSIGYDSAMTAVETDEDAIRRLHAAWAEASRARDLATILELVSDDFVFLVPGAPPFAGKDAVAGVYQQMFARWGDARIEQSGTIDEIIVSGDVAVWRGRDAIAVTSADGVRLMAASGYAMGVLRREGGRWKFARGINNMTRTDVA